MRVALVGLPADSSVSPTALAICCDRATAFDPEQIWLAARAGHLVLGQTTPKTLAAEGIDWIAAPGTFEGPGRLRAGHRQILARRYVLAPTVRLPPPSITGLGAVGFCRPQDVLGKGSQGARHWTILGNDPTTIAWAQRLARWNKVVTLVVPESQLLHDLASPISALALQRVLEADGVLVRLQTAVQSIEANSGGVKTLVADGGCRWQAEEVLAIGAWEPDWQQLNLNAIGVAAEAGAIGLDRQLRASDRRVYVCRTWLGEDAACQDAASILAAILRRAPLGRRPQRAPVPVWVRTQPTFASVGLTAIQAERQLPGQVATATCHLRGRARFVLDDATSGLCHLIASQNSSLLGLEILADGAEDAIALAAVALQQGSTVADLAELAVPSLSRAHLVVDTAREWQQEHRLRQRAARSWWRYWF